MAKYERFLNENLNPQAVESAAANVIFQENTNGKNSNKDDYLNSLYVSHMLENRFFIKINLMFLCLNF